MKTIKILSLFLISTLLASCGEDFFDLQPSTSVTTSTVYQTESDFDLTVVGCYAKLQGQVGFYTELCEYRSDNLYLSAPTTSTQDRYDIDWFQESPSNELLSDYWANFNNAVYRCNCVLDRIDDADFDESMKAQFKGEALFLRAYNYFNMYRTWGGVPTTTTVVTPAEAVYVARSSDAEMYDLLVGDLRNVIDNAMLPVEYDDDNIGRATIGAARTLLAKIYLTFGMASEAKSELEQVISLNKYQLLTDPLDIFDVDNKMNAEVVFAVRFNKDYDGQGHGTWFSISNLTDNSGRTDVLSNLYTSGDKRAELIEYTAVTGVNLYLMKKFYDTPSELYANYGNDQILMRFADVKLLLAEALNELDDPDYLTHLNDVRSRAGLTGYGTPDLTDQDARRAAILLERQKEFPYEGHRWFDLVRMGGAADAILADQGIVYQSYQAIYPIPTTVLERVNDLSLVWQNPGY